MLTFKQFLAEEVISPSTEPNTLTLWHGGNLEEAYDETMAHKKGRFEFGPGLYLTTHYDTARKYAKGSRKFYQIVISKGNNARNTSIDRKAIDDFAKTYVTKSKLKDVMFYLERQTKENGVPGYIFNNIMINNDAIKASYTGQLRSFLVNNGIDYDVVDNAFGWHETMIVLYNMKKIVSKKVIQPKDKIEVFDLPTGFN